MLQCCRRAPELDRKPRLCACRFRARHFDSRIDIAAMPEVLFDPALIVMAWSEGQSVLREAITRRPNPDPHKPRGRNSISLAFVLKRGKKRAGLGSAEGDFVRRHRLHQRAPRGHKLGGRGARRLPSHRGRGGGRCWSLPQHRRTAMPTPLKAIRLQCRAGADRLERSQQRE